MYVMFCDAQPHREEEKNLIFLFYLVNKKGMKKSQVAHSSARVFNLMTSLTRDLLHCLAILCYFALTIN
jgi:hypothetical protein